MFRCLSKYIQVAFRSMSILWLFHSRSIFIICLCSLVFISSLNLLSFVIWINMLCDSMSRPKIKVLTFFLDTETKCNLIPIKQYHNLFQKWVDKIFPPKGSAAAYWSWKKIWSFLKAVNLIYCIAAVKKDKSMGEIIFF